MLSGILANFYERDIRKLIDEVNLFDREEDLWTVQGAIKNSSGNLALHIVGGLNYLVGTVLGKTGYVRDRDGEFSRKGVPRKELVAGLEALVPLIRGVLDGLGEEGMAAEYPLVFDGMKVSNSYLLVQLLAHLNYHTGQVNYLRRALEQGR